MTADDVPPPAPTRRHLLKALAGLGVGSAVFQRALAADGREGRRRHARDDPSRPSGSPA